MPVLRTGRRARSGRAGFTLIEMMISLTIIAVMAMIIAPSLSEMQLSSRQTGASMDLVRLGRSVRAQAIATGVAHMLRYNGGPNGVGLIAVHVGMNSSCLQTPWDQTYAAANQDLLPRQFFDMAVYNPSVGSPIQASDTTRQVILLTATVAGGDPLNGLLICYQPNGDIYYNPAGDNAAATANLQRQNLPVTFQIVRRYDGAVMGRTRMVIFPPGGSARSL